MRQIYPFLNHLSEFIRLTGEANLFAGSSRKGHKAKLLTEIRNLICKQITSAHTQLFAAHNTAEL